MKSSQPAFGFFRYASTSWLQPQMLIFSFIVLPFESSYAAASPAEAFNRVAGMIAGYFMSSVIGFVYYAFKTSAVPYWRRLSWGAMVILFPIGEQLLVVIFKLQQLLDNSMLFRIAFICAPLVFSCFATRRVKGCLNV